MKKVREITHHPHTNEHKIYAMKPNMEENQLEGDSYTLFSFL
jgi:hypothetical protein